MVKEIDSHHVQKSRLSGEERCIHSYGDPEGIQVGTSWCRLQARAMDHGLTSRCPYGRDATMNGSGPVAR